MKEEAKIPERFGILTMQNYILDSINCGVFAYTLPEHEIFLINDVSKKIFGVQDNVSITKINKVIVEILKKQDNEKLRESLKNLNNVGDSINYKCNFVIDGETSIIDINTKLLQFKDGHKFILSTLRDVTKEYELDETLKKFNIVSSLAKNYRSLYLVEIENNKFTELKAISSVHGLLGSSGDAKNAVATWIENSIADAYKNEVKEFLDFKNVKAALSDKDTYSIEFKTKNYGWCQGSITIVNRGINGEVLDFLYSSRDINKEKTMELRAQETLISAVNSAEKANRAKTQFLSAMSHDIRTPMNAIIGMTAIASVNLGDTEKIADCLSKISISSKHLLGLINEVLDVSKIESGKISLQEEKFKISDLVETLMTMCKNQIEERQHKINVSVKDISHENVIGDPQRLQQAFMNLLGNSIKYTQNGGNLEFSVSEKPTHKENVACFEFVIKDNGIGMSKEYQEHLFEPFTRAENDDRVLKEQGTGLGMTITKNIIQMMNGTIEVESEINKGTKFTVTIFLKLPDPLEAEETTVNDLTSKLKSAKDITLNEFKNVDFSGKRILLVEDNDMNAEIASEILEMTKVSVERAKNGQDAIEKFNASSDGYYNLIFMDIQMPVMSGFDATRAIRAQEKPYAKNIPIVAMTANAFSDDVVAAKNCGMNEHIPKPLKLNLLLQILKDWL